VGTPAEIYDDPADRFVATFVGSPPMNMIGWNGGYLGFRPEQFLPRQMIENGPAAEFHFRVSRVEYLGSERIVYGEIEGQQPGQEVTAKLPLAHVPRDSIRAGDWHVFAVRDAALRYFDDDGRRARH
jgi:multiple sugar transport system ATP-binding protein